MMQNPGKIEPDFQKKTLPQDIRQSLAINETSDDTVIDSLPFAGRDTTFGCENEFQAVVSGDRKNLDIAQTIENSNYYKNLIRRAASGDTSRKTLAGLEKYLAKTSDQGWENSWVKFPAQCLNAYTANIFRSDLKSDKTDPRSDLRSDAHRFTVTENGTSFIRIPASYLLKLSLAQAVGQIPSLHPYIRIAGEKMMAHFSNDNTSPEIFSFYPVRGLGAQSAGTQLAKETVIRFLFTQLLVDYAQADFKLKDHGQSVNVYFSASPPVMQKQLNDTISDGFYRHLFISPCLSGWNRGEEKYEYMKLCHRVLSVSHINAVTKLKQAGIINSNLVVLPNSSHVCLANNGTHISSGSKKLERLLSSDTSNFTPAHEKYIADLVIKISEHFAPLFPGTYSASPYRLNFEDFHPEKVLNFLPHELDFTHLRMVWRMWKQKAHIKILGRPLTPFGPVWLDRMIRRLFFLKGDFLPDFRLLDYLVCLMSTDQSPALDGIPGNCDRLKKDLAHMGTFNEKMPLYQLIRAREFSSMGYSGFEHRHYSIFEDIMDDMGAAADLQNLITALAYQYIVSGKVTHACIPDTPDVESERRQIFFGAAIGLKYCFVKSRTPNRFLSYILSKTKKSRPSRRYPGYTMVRMSDYKRALISTLKTDARALTENLNMSGMLADLEFRTTSGKYYTTAQRLTRGILSGKKKKNPLTMDAERFNKDAEQYYSQKLRQKHIRQGFRELEKEFEQMDLLADFRDPGLGTAIRKILGDQDLNLFFNQFRKTYFESQPHPEMLHKMILLIIVYVHQKEKVFSGK